MHSVKASLVAAAVFAASVNSQYVIDPDSIPLAIRSQWCTTQISSCPLLCLQLKGQSGTTAANDCDPTTLTFDCICGNGLSPNASEYSQTLPYFLCREYGQRCVTACNGATACQSACLTDNPCGAQDPVRVNTTATSSMPQTATSAGSSGTDGVVYTGLGGSSEPTAASSDSTSSSDKKSSASQVALDFGRSYGLVAVFAGVFAGFALVM